MYKEQHKHLKYLQKYISGIANFNNDFCIWGGGGQAVFLDINRDILSLFNKCLEISYHTWDFWKAMFHLLIGAFYRNFDGGKLLDTSFWTSFFSKSLSEYFSYLGYKWSKFWIFITQESISSNICEIYNCTV